MPRYQWRTLPRGMSNSPTLCQKFVAQVIDLIRIKWPSVYILHYMDDIVLADACQDQLFNCLQDLTHSLSLRGLQIAPDKVQIADPFTYLGYELFQQCVLTPQIQLRTSHLRTLSDFQSY